MCDSSIRTATSQWLLTPRPVSGRRRQIWNKIGAWHPRVSKLMAPLWRAPDQDASQRELVSRISTARTFFGHPHAHQRKQPTAFNTRPTTLGVSLFWPTALVACGVTRHKIRFKNGRADKIYTGRGGDDGGLSSHHTLGKPSRECSSLG